MPWWADILGTAAGIGATLLTGGAGASVAPYIAGGVTSLVSGLAQEAERSKQEQEAQRQAEKNQTMSILDQYKQANQLQQDYYQRYNAPLSGINLQRSITPVVGGWGKPYVLLGKKEGMFEKQIPILADNSPWFSVLKWQNFPYGSPNPINQF